MNCNKMVVKYLAYQLENDSNIYILYSTIFIR